MTNPDAQKLTELFNRQPLWLRKRIEGRFPYIHDCMNSKCVLGLSCDSYPIIQNYIRRQGGHADV